MTKICTTDHAPARFDFLPKLFHKCKPIARLFFLLLLFSFTASTVSAQGEANIPALIRTLPIDQQVGSNAVDVVFLTHDSVTSLENVNEGNPTGSDATFLIYSLFAPSDDLLPVSTTVSSASNVLYSHESDALFLFDSENGNLLGVNKFLNQPEPAEILRSSSQLLNVTSPVDMALDAVNGRILLLDSAARIVVAELNADGASEIDISSLGISTPGGVAFNPASSNIFVFDTSNHILYELSDTGSPVKTYDLSLLDLGTVQGITFAPSSDRTDGADVLHLFMISSTAPVQGFSLANPAELGIEAQMYIPLFSAGAGSELFTGLSLSGGEANSAILHTIYELDINKSTSSVPVVRDGAITPGVVRVTDTSGWPSSDPAGVEYYESLNQLFISDSEVNEPGALGETDNLYNVSMTGTLLSKISSLAYSEEPTGVGYNPSNDHFFISDDDNDEIYELDPGPDGQLGTADDVVTAIDTRVFNSMDPEGVAYDTQTPGLFIADGVNREIYHVLPGPNGLFDGIDDIHSNFDVSSIGVDDPEGLEYDPVSDNLFITSRTKEIFEIFKTSGALIQVYDVSSSSISKLSGIAIAPNSKDPSETSFYIVSRGVDSDSNSDPNVFNDGKLWEFSEAEGTTIPPLGTVVTTWPEGDIIDTTPDYTWDELAGAEGYRILVDDTQNLIYATDPSQPIPASSICSGGQCSVDLGATQGINLSVGTTYRWYVRGVSSSIPTGPWSPNRRFTVITTSSPPPAATLISPQGTVTTTTPIYTWSTVSTAENYTLVVYDVTNDVIVAMNNYPTSTICNGTLCAADAGIALGNGNYTWLVQASNSFGAGPWSTNPPIGSARLPAPKGGIASVQ